MTLHHHHPPGTQCQQYLSCYWPNQTLKVGSWDQKQVQGKVKARPGQGQGKVKDRSKKGQGNIKVTSRKGKIKER